MSAAYRPDGTRRNPLDGPLTLDEIKASAVPCEGCQRPAVGDRLWRQNRDTLKAEGFTRRQTATECLACYKRRRYGGNSPRTGDRWASDDLAAELALIGVPRNASEILRTAPRLGMTPAALEKALSRMAA